MTPLPSVSKSDVNLAHVDELALNDTDLLDRLSSEPLTPLFGDRHPVLLDKQGRAAALADGGHYQAGLRLTDGLDNGDRLNRLQAATTVHVKTIELLMASLHHGRSLLCNKLTRRAAARLLKLFAGKVIHQPFW